MMNTKSVNQPEVNPVPDARLAHLIHTPSYAMRKPWAPASGRAPAPRLIVIFRFQTPGQTHLNGALTPAFSDELGLPAG